MRRAENQRIDKNRHVKVSKKTQFYLGKLCGESTKGPFYYSKKGKSHSQQLEAPIGCASYSGRASQSAPRAATAAEYPIRASSKRTRVSGASVPPGNTFTVRHGELPPFAPTLPPTQNCESETPNPRLSALMHASLHDQNS